MPLSLGQFSGHSESDKDDLVSGQDTTLPGPSGRLSVLPFVRTRKNRAALYYCDGDPAVDVWHWTGWCPFPRPYLRRPGSTEAEVTCETENRYSD